MVCHHDGETVWHVLHPAKRGHSPGSVNQNDECGHKHIFKGDYSSLIKRLVREFCMA